MLNASCQAQLAFDFSRGHHAYSNLAVTSSNCFTSPASNVGMARSTSLDLINIKKSSASVLPMSRAIALWYRLAAALIYEAAEMAVKEGYGAKQIERIRELAKRMLERHVS